MDKKEAGLTPGKPLADETRGGTMTDLPKARSGRSSSLWIVAGLIVLPLAILAGRWMRRQAHESMAVTPEANPIAAQSFRISRGEVIYQTYCGKCHGPDGHGDGEGVSQLAVRPRDFRSQTWKFAKDRPTIRRVVSQGIPGSPMPAAKPALSDVDLDLVTDFVLQLASSSSSNSPVSSEPVDPLTVAVQAAGFQPVPWRAAPDKSRFVRTDNDEPIALESFRGQPVLLHFWGTSCAHCLADFPAVVKLADACRSVGLNWLSVCADEDDGVTIERVARDRIGAHAVYRDESGLAIHQFQVQILPTFILIDAQGRIIATKTGGIRASPAAMSRLVELCKTTGQK